jgi:hypothetical protein
VLHARNSARDVWEKELSEEWAAKYAVYAAEKQAKSPMSGTNDNLRVLLDQAAAEEDFLHRLRRAEVFLPSDVAAPAASFPAMSLMITKQQRAELRELGFSDEAVIPVAKVDFPADLSTPCNPTP